MPWIFSYSELGPQIIQKVLKNAPFCALPATLPNYKVVFKGKSRKWGGAVATIEKSRKDFAYGSALLVPPDEVKLIDNYYKIFERRLLPVFIDATQDKVKANVYLLKDSIPYGEPSQEYISALVKHLKFFWGGGGKSVTLEDFGISTEIPIKKIISNIKTEIEQETKKPEKAEEKVKRAKRNKRKARKKTSKTK